MKKFFSAMVAVIMLGVILTGAGVLGKIDTESVKIAQEQGRIIPCASVNVSFLAPTPLNYSVVPLFSPLIQNGLRESVWSLSERTS